MKIDSQAGVVETKLDTGEGNKINHTGEEV